MAEKQKNLSPEEKLLNVIQGKEKSEPPAAGAAKRPAKPQPPAPIAPPPSVVAQTTDPLKLASAANSAPQSRPSAPVSPPKPAAPEPAGKTAGPESVAAPAQFPKRTVPAARANLKAPGENRLDVRSRTLATVNRLLRVAVALVVGLCAWEIFANCRTVPVPEKMVLGATPKGVRPPPVSSESCFAVLASFDGKSLFTPVAAEGVEPTVTNIETKTTVSEVQQYVTRNLNLIGVSPGSDGTMQEAILTDAQTKRNYFLKVGDKISVKNWSIELKQISADNAVFLCGKEEIRVR